MMKCLSTFLTVTLLGPHMGLAQYYPDTLSTGFSGDIKADGNIFEITATHQALLIERLDIHMETGTEEFKVFYRPGKADHRYDESYEEIFSGIVTGNGRGVVTPLPAFSTPVKIFPRSPVTFYISVSNHDGINVWYDRGSGIGTVYASDDYLNITEGYASGYPWNGYALDRQWNGIIHYSQYLPDSTRNPTAAPVRMIGTPNPTNRPTPRPNRPTKRPTKFPTRRPTKFPTSISTPNPTNPIITSVDSPVNNVDDINARTGDDNEENVDPPTQSTTSIPTTTTESQIPTQGTETSTNEPSPSPSMSEETFGPTKSTIIDLFPNFLPSSASSRFNFMERVFTFSFPLFILAFFLL